MDEMAITDLPHVQGNDNRARPLWYHSSGVAGTHVAHGPELSIIVPAFNERENIAPLVEQVAAALPDVQWELILVDDDSRDGTAAAVRRLAQSDARVRCIQRVGRGGRFPAGGRRYTPAPPLSGGVKGGGEAPRVPAPPAVTAPVAGFSHSTLSTWVVAERFTVNPPEPG